MVNTWIERYSKPTLLSVHAIGHHSDGHRKRDRFQILMVLKEQIDLVLAHLTHDFYGNSGLKADESLRP